VGVRHSVVDILLVPGAATGTNHVEACPKVKIKSTLLPPTVRHVDD
jgi:hypothetical protein